MDYKKKKITIADIAELKKQFHLKGLNTVCQSAKCPNIGECFKKHTATFLILGNRCTRGCSFCGIEKLNPENVNPDEPQIVAQTIKNLKLNYSVITSVTRDDLQDGGASHFAKTVSSIKNIDSDIKVEVLVPDFQGDLTAVDAVLNSKPDVFSHNLETVPALYSKVRKGADFKRSVAVLKYAKNKGFKVKTGIMLGLGETQSQIYEVIKEIAKESIDIITIGQYLAPTKNHHPVIKEYSADDFQQFNDFSNNLGLKAVSGRYVRSSYLAEEYYS